MISATAMRWPILIVALMSAVLSAWMIVTLPVAGTVQAGWRHEIVCTVLAALAIYAVTWMQGRPWPQPAAVLATAQFLAVVAMLLAAGAWGRQPQLGIAAILLPIAAVATSVLELRAAQRSVLGMAVIVLALLDLGAITPAFALLAQNGTLR